MTKLHLHNIAKSFNNHTVLQGITLSANEGDVIALLGSSGSGKSTLLRCINLLTLADSGSLQVDHHLIEFSQHQQSVLSKTEMTALRRRIGMVFQQFNLWSHMTILNNLIAAPCFVLKQAKADAIQEASALLERMGLANKLHHYPAQLSGGQQQRVAIARALMMKPEIMLFDEPTSALDPEMVEEVLTVMQQLATQGMTMLIATHELSFARRVANRSVFLDGGKIVEEGETTALFNQPASVKFQRFLETLRY
ncbi:MAG: amino acid ABC transporter ATP-binding protein [Gammaproteobacteria bacterium]|nr:amino acid ABC transporter ATP-binding protein [Gammaproteobacteria bacterium]